MQVSVETVSGLERRLTIVLPAQKIESAVDARIQKTAPQIKIDGFRAGKVPVRVVRQRYGESIRQEVLGDLMSNAFYEAVGQEKLRPAGQPTIDAKASDAGKDFSFTASFEVYPEIKVKGLDGVSITNAQVEIASADVDETLETIRKQQASFVDADKAAENGDQVIIDFEGFKDGVAFAGGKGEGQALVLGSKSMIPGFEDGLLGVRAGDEKELNLTFPEDYHAEELKGAAVVFKVKVQNVQEQKLPEIDGEFIARFGLDKEASLEELKAEIEKNMQRELKQALKNHKKKQVLDAVKEKNSIEVPKALINQEIDALRRQTLQQFGGGAQFDKLDLNAILPAEMFQERAQERVSLGLLLAQVIEDKKITADADKVRETVEEIASAYEVKEQVINYYYSNQQQLAQVESLVLEDAVIEALLESANVEDKAMSYSELMQAVSA